jgi:predicted PP-loop superfamily ATPase
MNGSMDGGFQFSGMCHHVAMQVVPNALKESDTLIFKGSGSMKSASFCVLKEYFCVF